MNRPPALSEAAQAAEAFLRGHEVTPALSYVFKIKDTTLNSKEITWKSFARVPGDEDFRYLFNGHLVDLERQGGEGTSQAQVLDDQTKRVAAVVTSCAKAALFSCFKAKAVSPEDIIWFCQTETGPINGLHVHLVVGGKGFGPANGKWILRVLQREFGRWLASCCSVDLSPSERVALRDHVTPNHFVTLLQYKHKSTGRQYCKPVDFGSIIMNYFFNKEPYSRNPDHCYIISWDSASLTTDLPWSERRLIHQRYVTHSHASKTPAKRQTESDEIDSTEPQRKKKRQVTQRELCTKEIVDGLTEKRIVTLEDWMIDDPDTYIQALTSPGGQQYCINMLEISGLRVSKDCTAFKLIIEKATDTCKLSETKVWSVFAKNKFNPLKAIHAIMCVLNKQSGKRNTILFFGPATTGKSLLAQTLAKEVKNVGCYNPANVNFPFNDCLNKNLIWVEEAGNLGQQVNQFKAVMSGQDIRVDQKGKGSKPLNSTPVVMTSNEDITQVRVGCELRPEHTQPIRDRLVAFHLTEKLGGDFGLIDDGEFGRIFRTMVELGYQPTMASYVHWWGSLPTYGEDWASPAIKDPQDEDETDAELQRLLDAFASDSLLEEVPDVETAADNIPLPATSEADAVRGTWREPVADKAICIEDLFDTSLLDHTQVSRQCLEVSFISQDVGYADSLAYLSCTLARRPTNYNMLANKDMETNLQRSTNTDHRK